MASARVCQFASATAGIERVGGAIEKGPLLENEVLPRALIPVGARARKRQVFQVKGAEIAIQFHRRQARTRAFGAGLERRSEATDGNAPPLGICLTIETLDELPVNRQS